MKRRKKEEAVPSSRQSSPVTAMPMATGVLVFLCREPFEWV